jgi:hypothetical protein
MDQHRWNQKLAHTLLKLSKNIQGLEEEINAAEKENKELKEYRTKAAAALTEMRQHAANNAVDDEKVRHDYAELFYAASNWASNHCGATTSRPLSKEDYQQINTLTAAPERYLQNKRLRPLLIQSLIAKRLAADVLTFSEHGGLLWAGGMSQSLRTLSIALYNDVTASTQAGPNERAQVSRLKEFSIWKAKTASLMKDQVEVAQIKQLIHEYTENLFSRLQSFVTIPKATMRQDLRDIVGKAVMLDKQLFESRAIFDFGTWAGKGESLTTIGYQFNTALMQPAIGFEDAKHGMRAEILLAPSLLKIGTADGDSFDKSMYLEKWVVICKESRLKKQRW